MMSKFEPALAQAIREMNEAIEHYEAELKGEPYKWLRKEMMKNKFEIGSQWKTRGGWRAVVVDNEAKGSNLRLKVWHKGGDGVRVHALSGVYDEPLRTYPEYDLIEPWVEPVVHEGWVNIYSPFGTKEDANKAASNHRIACIKIKFTEGEGLDDQTRHILLKTKR